jgi:hypothetical protein
VEIPTSTIGNLPAIGQSLLTIARSRHVTEDTIPDPDTVNTTRRSSRNKGKEVVYGRGALRSQGESSNTLIVVQSVPDSDGDSETEDAEKAPRKAISAVQKASQRIRDVLARDKSIREVPIRDALIRDTLILDAPTQDAPILDTPVLDTLAPDTLAPDTPAPEGSRLERDIGESGWHGLESASDDSLYCRTIPTRRTRQQGNSAQRRQVSHNSDISEQSELQVQETIQVVKDLCYMRIPYQTGKRGHSASDIY